MGSMGTDLGTVGEEDGDEPAAAAAAAGAVQIPQRRNRPDDGLSKMLSAVSTNPARAGGARSRIQRLLDRLTGKETNQFATNQTHS